MAEGLDYSFSHPSLQCVKNSGYTFVARYIGDPDPNSAKYLDAVELAQIVAAGLSVVVVRETTAGFMFTDSGRDHAIVSRAHCNALGLVGIPIYYALDVDPRGLSQSQRDAVTKFLQDAAAADGGGKNVGLYGSDDAIDWWVGHSYCKYGWQTYAWSSGRISPKANFRQYLNGQNICSGTVDLNETYTTDYGQWPRPFTTTPPEDSLSAEEVKQIQDYINDRNAYFAQSPHHPAVFVVYKQAGHKRWLVDQTAVAAARDDRVFAKEVRPDGSVVPWERSKEHLDSIPTHGDMPEGW